MEYQNVTLSLPKATLRRAKHIAIERGTSLSGLLTSFIGGTDATGRCVLPDKAGSSDRTGKI